MILLIEEDNGEQYEDYHKWVARAYDIATDCTADELDKAWKKEVAEIMLRHNIIVNPNYLNIMEVSKIKNNKLHKKILKENDFYTWLELNHKVKEVKFEVY